MTQAVVMAILFGLRRNGELGERVSPDCNSAGELAKPWAFWNLTAVLFALAQAASAECFCAQQVLKLRTGENVEATRESSHAQG